MKIVVTGAGGQLGQAMARRLSRAAYRDGARARRSRRRRRHDRVMPRVVGAAPGRDRQLRRLQRRRSGRGRRAWPRSTGTPSPCSRSRARRHAKARRSCTTAPTSCSTATRSRRTSKTHPARRSASTASRSCWASGSRATRRGATSCGSRACSAGRCRASSVDRIAAALRAGRGGARFDDRTVSPSFVEDAVAATRALLERGAGAGLYHCVNSGDDDVARPRRGDRGDARRRSRGSCPVRLADVPMRRAAPAYCALSNAKLAAAGFRCPPGRTPSADT